ncbi:MAG TPA: glycosyl hydrolase [Chitinispirillaceae bacterium]|nr:glycosyl hydrolase [Chitinispirillaceae bacterium]
MIQQIVCFALVLSLGISSFADRYEAESAIVDENSVQKIADADASGGYYVNMKEGTLSFKANIATAGFYTLWVHYTQTGDPVHKIQNLSLNGAMIGQIDFPYTASFVHLKASAKIKLSAGANTLAITKSWGWVNVDYVELTPYEDVSPFSISSSLVSPNASINAKKIYNFLRENFQKKVISGVMTSDVMQTDGKNTPDTLENQTEVAWVMKASGKIPALTGLDFLHAVGQKTEGEWYLGYTKATISLAETVFKKGGIPAYSFHWRDPSHVTEAFYTTYTTFNLKKMYADSLTCTSYNTSSDEYQAIIRDLDIIAGYLKILAEKEVPILWRPLHEASGKWFWWGEQGPEACKGLYRLMFDRFINHHHLNNLIWVWTTDEAGDALDWYPGDEYVDIIGRDFYYYPREANHGSLAASFEKVKELFKGKKIVALSENGSIPYPDNLVGDGAGWSYFMPWNLDYTMDGWAHDNTAADWKLILNHDYVITLDEMPGWSNYTVQAKKPEKNATSSVSIKYNSGILDVSLIDENTASIEIYNLQGIRISTLSKGLLREGIYHFPLNTIAKGMYFVNVKNGISSKNVVEPIMIK